LYPVVFSNRAKCITNTVTINEELTADEWKRRWEKERHKVARLKGQLARAEFELERWRRGKSTMNTHTHTLYCASFLLFRRNSLTR